MHGSAADVEQIALPLALAAAEQVAKHQGDRDALPAGCRAEIALRLVGHIEIFEGALVHYCRIEQPIHGTLTVNPDQVRAASTAAPIEDVLAIAFASLSPATRDELLESIPADYAAGNLLPDPALSASIEHMLKRMRQSKTQHVRGSVRFEPAAGNTAEAA